jgi:anaerobic ribonucleoside-triphosphate reductase activating protein
MYVARILYPVKVLGRGNRIGIWVAGCNHRCKGCSNPELWNFDDRYLVTIQQVEQLIRNVAKENVIDGFTITGGEPMEQPEELSDLLERVKDISDDVILYTGYEIGELVLDKQKALLGKIAVLIDGQYREELNDDTFLRGSSNQNIIILNRKYEKLYSDYLKNGHNEIQNFMIKNEVVSVGIHKKDFKF